ncbi:MAG: precorrin-8X/cobalt-precorrin-8 methylmutase [Chloroflexota bacterium]|nr:precorrin-8X/cobalt-precorrin-8 methylmutase [Chloroflexota bacterium]
MTVPGEGRALAALGLPPAEIEALSMARLRAATTVVLPPPPAEQVALRIAYAAGDPGLLGELVVPVAAVEAAVAALGAGAAVICDVAMVAAGARARLAKLGIEPLVAVEAAGRPLPALLGAATRAAVEASSRSARGLLALAGQMGGAVLVIGNAPTALLALLDALADGAPAPAAVVASCCGLVAAGEAKELLLARPPVPAIVVRGTRGGSATAAAALNALCALALDRSRAGHSAP